MIKALQAEIKVWQDKNFPTATANDMFDGIVEEVGELANAKLKAKVLRRDTLAKEKDAIGDIYVFLNGYCQKRGFELEDIIKEVWAEVKQRDYRQWKCRHCGKENPAQRVLCQMCNKIKWPKQKYIGE